jgi:hypothetical protein
LSGEARLHRALERSLECGSYVDAYRKAEDEYNEAFDAWWHSGPDGVVPPLLGFRLNRRNPTPQTNSCPDTPFALILASISALTSLQSLAKATTGMAATISGVTPDKRRTFNRGTPLAYGSSTGEIGRRRSS